MAKKKPVWVDEDAHAVLKQYSKKIKTSMADVASDMVLSKIDDLPADAGIEPPTSHEADAAKAAEAPRAAAKTTPQKVKQAAESDKSRPTADAPITSNAPDAAPPKKESLTEDAPEEDDSGTRFLGGVWLV